MTKLTKALVYLNRRRVRVVLSLLLTMIVGALLIVTIRFTLFDLQWLAFLGGILFAAVLSMVSQASKAEWIIARRTSQLDHVREQLARELSRSRSAEESRRTTEARMHMVNDALPVPILFVDRDLRIRYHNKAACELTGWPDDRIEGQLLRDVVRDHYSVMLEHLKQPMNGVGKDYALAWQDRDGTPHNLRVRQLPHPAGEEHPLGCYLVMIPESFSGTQANPVPAARTPTDAQAVITNESGGNLYLHSLSDQLMGWDEPRNKLVSALENNGFLLFAQRILALSGNQAGQGHYEILLRLQEEEDNLLPPGGFIPVAERYGMTEDIDRWVVRNLISWSLEQRRISPAWDIPLFCVNLSDASVSNPEFARFVRQELQRTQYPPQRLCFEIGELETINNHATVGNFINALKPVGCRFTIDSFGSIKLSFSHLSGLAVDFIKIDGVIIQNMFKTPADTTKLKAIVNICRKIGVRTIAEFVEDERTLHKLKELGIDHAQGFGIDRPGPISRIS